MRTRSKKKTIPTEIEAVAALTPQIEQLRLLRLSIAQRFLASPDQTLRLLREHGIVQHEEEVDLEDLRLASTEHLSKMSARTMAKTRIVHGDEVGLLEWIAKHDAATTE